MVVVVLLVRFCGGGGGGLCGNACVLSSLAFSVHAKSVAGTRSEHRFPAPSSKGRMS